jgi:hypothetical protein
MPPIFTTTVKTYLFNRLPVSVTNHKIILPHDPEECKNNFHWCELQMSSHMLRYYKYICCKICSNSLVYLIYQTMKQFTAFTHSFTLSSLSLLQRPLALQFPQTWSTDRALTLPNLLIYHFLLIAF